MFKEKYWQKVISFAFFAHIVQGVIMAITGSTTNPLLSIGMIIIAIGSVYRFYTASERTFEDQEF